MSDRRNRDGYKTDEQRAREQAYQEYLRLRENKAQEAMGRAAPSQGQRPASTGRSRIKDDTLYGEYFSGRSNVQRQEQAMRRGNMQPQEASRRQTAGQGANMSEADYRQRMDAYKQQRQNGAYQNPQSTSRGLSPEEAREEYLRARGGSSQSRVKEESSVDKPSRRREKSGKSIARQGRKNKADKGLIEDNYSMSAPAAGFGGSGGNGNGGSGRKTGKKAKKSRKKGRGLKIALIVVLVLVLAIGGTIAAGLTVVKKTLDNVGRIELDPDLIGIDPEVDAQLEGYRNIALLGIDARDMSSDEGVRSDAMIVASINKETGEIKMFSVYRDTMLDLGDDVGLDKATHAYYYGGPTKALYALNKNLDLNIKEVVVVNWKSVADTVDALGGLDIEIQDSEISEMNKYIIDTYNNIGGSNALIESSGMQTLNGNQAVTYARIRKDATTGDYRRNERMKIVVKAAFDKAKTTKLTKLKKISNKVLPEIKTNMSSMDMMGMVLKLDKYKMTDSVGWPYDVASWVGDAWYGPPRTLTTNVTKLHEQFFNQPDYTPTQRVQDISENISYKTGIY